MKFLGLRSPWLAGSFALFAPVLAASSACSTSTSDTTPTNAGETDGGHSVDDASAVTSKVHASCSGTATATGPTLPASFGKSCAMGSNLALCADPSASECGDAPCLWDQNAVTEIKAYCTIGCDPTSSTACPAHFQCRSQGCDSGPANVCVRTEADPSSTRDCKDIVSGRNATINDVVQGRDGRLFAFVTLQSPGERSFFTRGPGETTWTKTYTLTTMIQQNAGRGPSVAAADALYYVIGGGLVLRMSATEVTEEHYADCTSHCSSVVEAVFAPSGGGVRLVESGGSGGTMRERRAEGSWSVVTDAVTKRFSPVATFSKGGFLARCQDEAGKFETPCVGDSGQDLVDLQIPSGKLAEVGTQEGTTAALGMSPSDFWFFSDKGTLYHRLGSETLEEGLPPPTETDKSGLLATLSDGSIVAVRGDKTFVLDQGCWRAIAGAIVTGYATGGRQLGAPSNLGQFCESSVP
jgi:hypothetical protein